MSSLQDRIMNDERLKPSTAMFAMRLLSRYGENAMLSMGELRALMGCGASTVYAHLEALRVAGYLRHSAVYGEGVSIEFVQPAADCAPDESFQYSENLEGSGRKVSNIPENRNIGVRENPRLLKNNKVKLSQVNPKGDLNLTCDPAEFDPELYAVLVEHLGSAYSGNARRLASTGVLTVEHVIRHANNARTELAEKYTPGLLSFRLDQVRKGDAPPAPKAAAKKLSFREIAKNI